MNFNVVHIYVYMYIYKGTYIHNYYIIIICVNFQNEIMLQLGKIYLNKNNTK